MGNRKIPGQLFSEGIRPETPMVKTSPLLEEEQQHSISLALWETECLVCVNQGAEVTGWNEHQRVMWLGTGSSEAFSFRYTVSSVKMK